MVRLDDVELNRIFAILSDCNQLLEAENIDFEKLGGDK